MSTMTGTDDGVTFAGAVAWATRVLDTATPRLDAEVLLAHVTGGDRSRLYREPERALTPVWRERYRELVAARAAGRPVAQLTGRAEFWSMSFEVDDHVLVPRADTERLCEIALANVPRERRVVIADLGTGSGALAIAVASERPNAHVVASDTSAAVLRIAGRNRRRHATRNVSLARASWLDATRDGALDGIIANPPYVEDGDPCLLADGVRSEPRAALVAGADGLDALRRIVRDAPRCLVPGGFVALEHGACQGAAVRRLLAAAGFVDIATARDLGGLERVTHGCRASS